VGKKFQAEFSRPSLSTVSGEFRAIVLNDELDKQIAMLQQVAEDVGRAVAFPATSPSTVDLTLPEPAANGLIAWSAGADGLVNGPSTTEIDASVSAAAASASAAASSATDAANSASMAATHETNAGNSAGTAATEAANAASSAGQAATSATQAANAAASNMYSTVENKTFADSPIAVGASDNGTLFVVDTTGGAVVVNLPDIDTVGEAFRCGVLKDDGGSNTITVNGDGTDTLNGSATYVIANAREMANFVADERGATDNWVAFGGGVSAGNRTTEIFVADERGATDNWVAFGGGVSAGNRTTEIFVDSTDYTSGTTTLLTLANDYGAEDNIDVLFDGHGQHRNTYSLVDTTLTFTAAIPLGTAEVQVTGGYTQPIAVPADNSVTTAKINAGAVTGAKLSDTVIDDLTTETAIDGDNDFVMMHDASVNAKRKISVTNLMQDVTAIVICEVRMWPTATAPSGFLICDGSEISRTTYADLFVVIGTTFGVGDGSTTFNLPDMRGRVVGGANDVGLPNGENGSFSTRNEAGTTGAETHQLTVSEMPSHSHSYTRQWDASSGSGYSTAEGGGAGSSSQTTGSAGNGNSHNNMQPTIFLNFIIATGV